MYDGLSVSELVVKRKLCAWIIKLLKTKWADDPRAPKAEGHYQAEHEKICAALVRKQQRGPDLTIGMKSLTLRGETSMGR